VFERGRYSGQYGNCCSYLLPPVVGLRTVVSSATAAGTAIVGAMKAATTVYRKGGVRVESTTSHATDFTNNLVTPRIEMREALAVRIPAAVAKVGLTGTPAEG